MTYIQRTKLKNKIYQLQILSRDSVTVSVDAVVYFNVTDSVLALCSVSDFRWLSDRKGKRGPKDILTS